MKPLVGNFKKNQENEESQRISEEILKAPSLASHDLYKKLKEKSNIYIFDVRSLSDFERGHIETSKNVGSDKLKKDYLEKLGAEKTSDIVLVGSGDDLATLAPLANQLVAAGYSNAKYLQGGLPDWQKSGYYLISSGGMESDNQKVKKITIDELKKETETNPDMLQFLDVREKDIFAKEHIIQAMNIPLSELETRKNEIPAAKKIIVCGANESESFQAAVILFDLNFWNAYILDGDMAAWKSAGGNVE